MARSPSYDTSRDPSRADRHLTVEPELFGSDRDYRGFYEALISCTDVGLVAIDPQGRYVLLNDEGRRLMDLAYPRGHAGRAGQVGEVFAADGVTRVPRAELPSARAARGEEFDDLAVWVGSDPVARRLISTSARVMRDAAGRVVGTVMAARDVTESARADQARDDFLAVISHELRTPLTSVLGYLEILGEEALEAPGPLRAHLEVARRNAERLLRLVDELLSANRIGHGLLLNRGPTSLPDLVRRAVDSARPAADRAGVSLSVGTVVMPDLLLDADRMAEVLDNLLTNAVKFTPAGGAVSVSVSVNGADAVVVVRDTGVGIPSEDRDAVFDRFFRSPVARDAAVPGVGLGLHIVKVIVEAHGGSVRASSRRDPDHPAPGTEVVVRLPLTSG